MKKSMILLVLAVLFSAPALSAQNLKVEMFATEITKRLMHSISSNTGNTPSAYVYAWDYNSSTKRFTIKMSANWYARRCMMCSGEDHFEVIGFLEVGYAGTNPVFTEISRNDAVRKAWSNEEIAVLIQIGALVASASNDGN